MTYSIHLERDFPLVHQQLARMVPDGTSPIGFLKLSVESNYIRLWTYEEYDGRFSGFIRADTSNLYRQLQPMLEALYPEDWEVPILIEGQYENSLGRYLGDTLNYFHRLYDYHMNENESTPANIYWGKLQPMVNSLNFEDLGFIEGDGISPREDNAGRALSVEVANMIVGLPIFKEWFLKAWWGSWYGRVPSKPPNPCEIAECTQQDCYMGDAPHTQPDNCEECFVPREYMIMTGIPAIRLCALHTQCDMLHLSAACRCAKTVRKYSTCSARHNNGKVVNHGPRSQCPTCKVEIPRRVYTQKGYKLQPIRTVSYTYKPSPVFFPWEGNPDKELYIGMELELELGSVDTDMAGGWIQSLPSFMYVKQDSSLNHGLEVVTHPMQPDWALENFPYKEFEYLISLGAEPTAPSAGTHVHINKSALSKAHMFKLIKFHTKLAGFCGEVGGRGTRASFGTFQGVDDLTVPQTLEIARTGRGALGRNAVNISPPNTVELRYMRGGIDPKEIRKNIQWVKALWLYTRNTPTPEFFAELSQEHFMNFINQQTDQYSELLDWIGNNESGN